MLLRLLFNKRRSGNPILPELFEALFEGFVGTGTVFSAATPWRILFTSGRNVGTHAATMALEHSRPEMKDGHT